MDRSYLVPVVVALERQNLFTECVAASSAQVTYAIGHGFFFDSLQAAHKFQDSACGLLVRGCCNWDRSCACIESSKHLGVPPIFRGCRLLLLCRKLAQARTSGVPALLESSLYWRRVQHEVAYDHLVVEATGRRLLISSRCRSDRHEVAYDHPVAPCKVVESGETRPIPRRLRIRSVVCDDYRLIVSLTIVILST